MQYNFPYVRPDFNENRFQMYRFLQTPPSIELNESDYGIKTNLWNSDIHLISTYCFLSEEERALFAAKEQNYLIKTILVLGFQNSLVSLLVSLPIFLQRQLTKIFLSVIYE